MVSVQDPPSSVDDLPEGTMFLDVEGTAVAFLPPDPELGSNAFAFGPDGTVRRFRDAKASLEGTIISRADFLNLIDNPY